MTSQVPPSPEANCVLPPQLLMLGEALVPVASAARRALARRVRQTGQRFLMLESLAQHMGWIEHALSRLTPRLDGLMADVIQKPAAGPLDVGRSVGRLEEVISEVVDGYLLAKASRPDAEGAEAHTLLLGVYRHHIQELCDWLDEIVSTVSNPSAALHRQGLEPIDGVVLTVPLNMTSPPEMAKLAALVEAIQSRLEERVNSPMEPQQTRSEGPGVFGTIGAVAFGVGLSQAVFGRNHG